MTTRWVFLAAWVLPGVADAAEICVQPSGGGCRRQSREP